LAERPPVAFFHVALDLHDWSGGFARGIDEHAFDGGASDIESGEVCFHGKWEWSGKSRRER
jgi:hypothetical protein